MISIGVNTKRVISSYYEKKDCYFSIIETAKDGKANLALTFENINQYELYKLEQEKTPWLMFAENKRCADGVVLAIDLTNKKAKIYLIELKSKMNSNKWNDVLGQFRGSILRSLSFCSTIGIDEIEDIYLHTAFTDRTELDSEKETIEMRKKIENHQPAAHKLMTGVAVGGIDQWGSNNVKPFKEGQSFSHSYIQLSHKNGLNEGSYTIVI